MLKHLEKRRQKNEEEGFTLIELMVVVLIMGILMAIAIPTFLSTRGSANDASAKSNATNAYTNEKSFYAANVFFTPALAPDQGGSSLDSTLPWGTGLGQVAAYTDVATSPQNLLVVAGSQSGDCFYIADMETSGGNGAAYIGYAETTGATATTGCPAPTTATGLTAFAPGDFKATGTAAANTTTTAPTVFYPSWT